MSLSGGGTATATGAGTVAVPTSGEEAAAALAADPAATVLAGGTLVVPMTGLSGQAASTVIWLGRAGLDAVDESDGRVTIGSMATLAACEAIGAPIGPCVANIADPEVRAQATVGGNLCAAAPLGDLRGPLLALDATVRLARGGEISEVSAAEFVEQPDGALVLGLSYDRPAAGGFVAVQRRHTSALTALAVSTARSADGTIRVAATGAGPNARRLASVEEALADGATPAEAAQRVDDDIEPYDDALASAAYRARVAPVVVRRAIEQLGG